MLCLLLLRPCVVWYGDTCQTQSAYQSKPDSINCKRMKERENQWQPEWRRRSQPLSLSPRLLLSRANGKETTSTFPNNAIKLFVVVLLGFDIVIFWLHFICSLSLVVLPQHRIAVACLAAFDLSLCIRINISGIWRNDNIVELMQFFFCSRWLLLLMPLVQFVLAFLCLFFTYWHGKR